MNRKEEVVNILNLVIPSDISILYIKLIKLIDLYNLKYYSLNIKNNEQRELVSMISRSSLEKKKQTLISIEQKKNFFIKNKDYGKANLLINNSDKIRKSILLQKQKINKWYFNELEINELINDISLLIGDINFYLKEVLSKNNNILNNFLNDEKYINMLNNSDNFSDTESKIIYSVISKHLELWENAFKKVIDIATLIINSYKKRELINVDELDFSLVYSCVDLCNSSDDYKIVLNSIFDEIDFVKFNNLNSIIVDNINNYFNFGFINNTFLSIYDDVNYVSRTYLSLQSLVVDSCKKNNNSVKQKIKNRL